MNITANAASLNWRTNNHGVWKALVKDMAPNSSVTFSDGLAGTVAGRQVTVESPSMPTGFMTYTTDDNTAVFGGVLYGAGTASDSLEAVGGDKTVRMGSYTFTGNETWAANDPSGYPHIVGFSMPDDFKSNGKAVIADYVVTAHLTSWRDPAEYSAGTQLTRLYVNDPRYTASDMAAHMAGKTIYYELATPTTSTETAQPMSLVQGSDTIGGGSFSATYEGTEYEIPLTANSKYLHRDVNGNDALITGTVSITSVGVTGGLSKLINLSTWFGRSYEPSIIDFYKLYPTWKTYDIPYIPVSILNYKGTGIQTIGFNAYNHETGTAELLGGNKYQICGTYTSVSYVDQWGKTEELELDDQGIFTPTNNGVLTVVGGNATDTCVHLCWSGYKNYGEAEYQWEPFVRNVHNIGVAAVFPDGMNGMGGVYDELYTDRTVKNFNVVDLGELTWTWIAQQTFGYWKTSKPSDIKPAASNNAAANVRSRYTSRPYSTFGGNLANYDCICVRSASSSDMYVCNGSSTEPPSGLMVYQTTTPVIVQLPSPINLTYPVNDFGTEQSLPVNTTDLVTTDLHALIRYNTDYMRMNTQLSEIFPTVRSLAQQEQAGEIMKTDATAPAATVGNAYNLIDRNAAGTERQFSFDTSGGTQDIADGTAVAKKVMGTTLNLNQLVHDTNENTVESVNGNATVGDAVEGNVKHLVVSGDTVVVNQLVHEYVEKTESGTGRIWIKDAFEKEAKGLKVTAPRSVVMNQLVQNGDFSDGTTGWGSNHVLVSVSEDKAVLTASNTPGGLGTNFISNPPLAAIAGHVGLISARFNTSVSHGVRIGLGNAAAEVTDVITIEANKWTILSFKGTFAANSFRAFIYPFAGGSWVDGDTVSIQQVQVIDLTQYFNGNQTLIDSIQTWDDLVAYDSAFASYVPYNTGTVKGVTPALTLNGANTPFATAPQEMFGIGTIGDEWNVVDGKYTQKIGVVDMGSLSWLAYYAPTENDPYGYTAASVPGKVLGRYNILTNKYLQGTTQVDKSIYGNTTTSFVYLTDSTLVGKTSSEVTTALSGVLLYYELATPVVTDVSPVVFDLVSHDNTIFQTSGDLKAGIEATYDGLNQTIALDPAHTYAFNHQYVEDSIITGESSIDCVGTEDNLVDLTQLYAGDATRIAAIRSWASLSSRIHMYRDWLPYNPGEIVNLSATIRVYQHEHAYGVVYDPSQSSPACQRVELNDGVITDVEEFSALPAHNFRRCVMDDLANRHVNYYLDPLDSTKKADGTPSVLTGADGDVMVEIPITHWYIDEDYNGEGKILWLVSDEPFTGSEVHPYFYVGPGGDTARTQYVGAYKIAVCTQEGVALNTTEGAISQATGDANTRLGRSVAGALPWIFGSFANYRDAAIRHGGNLINTRFHEFLYLMMIIEYGTLDSHAVSIGYSYGKVNDLWAHRKAGRVNHGNDTGELFAAAATQDEDNFYLIKLGGTTLYRDVPRDANGYFAWSNHASSNPVVYWTADAMPANGATVYSDAAGTDSGQVTSGRNYTDASKQVIQFQYRGIENPFGEVFEVVEGCQKYQMCDVLAIRVNGVVYYMDHSKDGSGTKMAWTTQDGSSTVWTAVKVSVDNAVVYADIDCTIDTGYKENVELRRRADCERWDTVDTASYTTVSQHAASSKVYERHRTYWPNSGYAVLFDPIAFMPRTITNATRYIYIYGYNTTGSRITHRGGSTTSTTSGTCCTTETYFTVAEGRNYISGRISC